MLGQLDCSQYTARVVTRGLGKVVWEEMPFTSLQWGRVLDDTSQAQIQLDGIDPTCASKLSLSGIVTWEHELAIYRAGTLVWVGPLVTRLAHGFQATLTGKDRSAWWDRRFIHGSYDLTADLATIFKAYFDDAMGVDPVAGFTCLPTATGIAGERIVAALDHKPAGPEMRELSDTAVDWTCLGPICLAGGRSIPTGQLPILTDDHLMGPPDVQDDGTNKVNHSLVTGAQPTDPVTGQTIDGPNVWGDSTDSTRRTRDGLIEANTQDDQAADAGSCTAYAQSQLALYGDGATTVSDLALAPNAPLTISQLVPGTIIGLALSQPAIAVQGVYRIAAVNVSVTPDQGEQVTVTVQPLGTT